MILELFLYKSYKYKHLRVYQQVTDAKLNC